MTSFTNRLAMLAIPILGSAKAMPKALAAGRAPTVPPGGRFMRRHKVVSQAFEGRDVWHILPRKGVTSKTVLYHVHGGGFVIGLTKEFYPAYGKLADLTGCRVIAPDYPLPPKSTGAEIRGWSRAHYDLTCETYGAENIVLSGDSAGANLALSLAQTQASPARLLLWSPWADLTHSDPAQDDITTEPLIDMVTIRAAAKRYAGEQSLTDPQVSPIFGDHSSLPQTHIYSGTHDVFHADIVKLHGVMQAGGVDARLHAGEGLTHDYMYFPTKEAGETLRHMAGVIKRV